MNSKPSVLALLAFALSAGHSPALARPELVWAPLFDQTVERACAGQGDLTFGHPDYHRGESRADVLETIRTGIQAAYAKGVRALDIGFFLGKDQVQPDYAMDYGNAPVRPERSDPGIPAFADSGEDWVRAVDAFNRLHPLDPIRLRLRLTAYASTLYYVYRTRKPYRTFLAREDPSKGLTRSRYSDLPFDPCFEKQTASDPCYAASPVAPGYYRSSGPGGNLLASVPNLANPAIRTHIALWAGDILDETLRITGRYTRIEEISLAIDAGGESGLFGDDSGGVVGFGDLRYRPDAGFKAASAFFRARETRLRETYAAFAAAAHTRRNRDGSGVAAGIFQQAHQMDGRARGTFDLYALLEGTGTDVLHHTQPPADLATSRAWTAYSASVAERLGIAFDTEFSWAHFGGDDFLNWRAEKLTTRNADRFLAQARAGIEYGASAVIYSNWTAHEWTRPPPEPQWRLLLGRSKPDWDDAHLSAPGGLLSFQVRAGPGKRAIWISTAGRMACEEAHASRSLAPPCTGGTYLRWFRDFGLTMEPEAGRVDILTDGMLAAGPEILSRYQSIYLPYETSGLADTAAIGAFDRAPPSVRKAIRYQVRAGDAGTGGFAEWKEKVRSP